MPVQRQLLVQACTFSYKKPSQTGFSEDKPERTNNIIKNGIVGGGKNESEHKLKMYGINVDGMKSKIESFKATLTEINPDIFFVQETKLVEEGFLKIAGYEVFERIRRHKGGGGVAIGVKPGLNPVQVNEGTDITETLSVVI